MMRSDDPHSPSRDESDQQYAHLIALSTAYEGYILELNAAHGDQQPQDVSAFYKAVLTFVWMRYDAICRAISKFEIDHATRIEAVGQKNYNEKSE